MNRLLLGSALSGRLLTRPLKRSTCTDLLWIGSNAAGAFDFILKETILNSWRRLHMITDGVIAPRPLPTKQKYVQWLARLERGIFQVEDRQGGGSEVFEIRRNWVRRPT
jgi:hypothetical protein